MTELLTGLPKTFKDRLTAYYSQIGDAIRRNAHHDHRRALLIEFLRKTFNIEMVLLPSPAKPKNAGFQ